MRIGGLSGMSRLRVNVGTDETYARLSLPMRHRKVFYSTAEHALAGIAALVPVASERIVVVDEYRIAKGAETVRANCDWY